MHIITEKPLRIFSYTHPDAKTPLYNWYKTAKKESFTSLMDLRTTFSDVEHIHGKLHCFNIGGNKYRLLAEVEYFKGKIYISEVLTHAEYSKNTWKKRLNIK